MGNAKFIEDNGRDISFEESIGDPTMVSTDAIDSDTVNSQHYHSYTSSRNSEPRYSYAASNANGGSIHSGWYIDSCGWANDLTSSSISALKKIH